MCFKGNIILRVERNSHAPTHVLQEGSTEVIEHSRGSSLEKNTNNEQVLLQIVSKPHFFRGSSRRSIYVLSEGVNNWQEDKIRAATDVTVQPRRYPGELKRLGMESPLSSATGCHEATWAAQLSRLEFKVEEVTSEAGRGRGGASDARPITSSAAPFSIADVSGSGSGNVTLPEGDNAAESSFPEVSSPSDAATAILSPGEAQNKQLDGPLQKGQRALRGLHRLRCDRGVRGPQGLVTGAGKPHYDPLITHPTQHRSMVMGTPPSCMKLRPSSFYDPNAFEGLLMALSGPAFHLNS
ncbi:unnamed protein product [Leuciscus chuanchicus]